VPGFLAVAAPLSADAGAAGHTDHAVDDENPAVIPVVVSIEGEGPQRPERLDATSGLGHLGAKLARHGECADSVQEHVDLNARAAALGDRGCDFFGGLAAFEDVLRVVDGSTGAPDHCQLRGEDFLTVEQDSTRLPGTTGVPEYPPSVAANAGCLVSRCGSSRCGVTREQPTAMTSRVRAIDASHVRARGNF
jgi:hypothetical protein